MGVEEKRRMKLEELALPLQMKKKIETKSFLMIQQL